jgi:hypothetical protein
MSTVTSDVPNVVVLSQRAANLNRSFAACVLFFVLNLLAPAVLGLPYSARSASIAVILLLAMIGSYVWYAIAAALAARTLGERAWTYVTWILIAPFVSQLVSLIGIPFMGSVLAASPLSIKFLLGNQLDEALRSATSMNLSRIDGN